VSHVNNSYSLKPLLGDEAGTSGRTHSFTEVSNGVNNRSYAVKDRRYKLVSTSTRQWELYDLVADPKEATNLYTSPAHAAALSTLKDELAALRAQAPNPAYFPQ
jgi:arylsulfatase A-like enzyme